MRYEGRIFRPPSEAYSLLLQATVGCSHNKCAFCDMYKEKSFYIRPLSDVLDDLHTAAEKYSHVEKIFICDGDALILPMDYWRPLLAEITRLFPRCRQVASYASPKSIKTKTDGDLLELAALGLSILYVGLESGSDEVLNLMEKGATAAEIIRCGVRVKAAGIRLSVTAISGLGGRSLWPEHAKATAAALSQMKPHYIGLLTLMLEENAPVTAWVKEGRFTLLSPLETIKECHMLIEHLDAEGAIFRSNHPSNYLTLKGTLNHDKPALLAQLSEAMAGVKSLRDEHFRAL